MYSQGSYFKYSLDSWPWRGAPEKHTVGSGGEGGCCADGLMGNKPLDPHSYTDTSGTPVKVFLGLANRPLQLLTQWARVRQTEVVIPLPSGTDAQLLFATPPKHLRLPPWQSFLPFGLRHPLLGHHP